jgi:dCTP deaminase
MILNDGDIRQSIASGSLVVDPFDYHLIQPASIDVRLGCNFKHGFFGHADSVLDLCNPPERVHLYDDHLHIGEPFVIEAKQFVLACLLERIVIPDFLQATLSGKSSVGRMGLFIENAGFVDSGFVGTLTLELFNANDYNLIIRPGMRIAQLSFQQLTSPALQPYGCASRDSHYQHQVDATPSRYSF